MDEGMDGGMNGWVDGWMDKRLISYNSYIERITQIHVIFNA
jgi:hypothetical protein